MPVYTGAKLSSALLGLLLSVPPARAENEAPAEEAPKERTEFQLSGVLMNSAHLRNDTDFDRSLRVDDRDGQSDGQVATYFLPRLRVKAPGGVVAAYELELGWNSWSRNNAGNPNQFFPSRQEGLQLRHRAIWGGYTQGAWALRVGYQRLRDPSGLFLDQRAGLAQLRWQEGDRRLKVELGQLAESSYEGVSVRDNNFTTDSVIGGLSFRQGLSGGARLELSTHGLRDGRSIGRPLQLFSTTAGVSLKKKGLRGGAHLVLQRGVWENAGLGGVDEEIQTWALQLGLSGRTQRLLWSINSLTLSGDNSEDGDGLWGAFLGSGRNRSRSVFLTEDERRDRYDNLDERVGSFWGPFSYNRAGLTVNEMSIGYHSERYIPRFVIAYGAALNPDNALGHRDLGVELSLLQRFPLSKHAALSLDGLIFLPGKAAAAFLNDIDRSATETLYGLSAGFVVDFE